MSLENVGKFEFLTDFVQRCCTRDRKNPLKSKDLNILTLIYEHYKKK